ncbi:hypothetical protein V6N13_041465 [Hibiscus sabdariffa]
MIDAASGGALFNMTPTQARELISTMATNSQQFGAISEPNQWVHEVNTVSIENKLDQVTNIVNSLVAEKNNPARVCGICTMTDHLTDCCPTLQEETVNAVGNFPGLPQRPYNPHGQLESRGKLPSQTETDSRANVSPITLRSGTTIGLEDPKDDAQKKDKEEEPLPTQKGIINLTTIPSSSEVPPPFPSRLVNWDKQAEDKGILDIFRKVEVNIPLLEVIRRVPRYARFLKDLCTSKRKLTRNEKVNLGEHVSAIFQQKLPPNMKDQGMFAIPCKIDKVKIKRAMCDLGASINVMPLSIYKMITNEPLKDTKVTIQLVDRSVINSEGLLENVLVEVDKLIFPADFYVINMENDQSNTSSEVLLGHPFLSTANTRI